MKIFKFQFINYNIKIFILLLYNDEMGNMEPGNVAEILGDGSILGSLIDVDEALASLVEDFVPTIRNSTTTCIPCGGAVRADSSSDDIHLRGWAITIKPGKMKMTALI